MKILCTFLFCAAFLFSGCSPSQPSPAGPRAASPAPSWQMSLDIPENIPADKPVELDVRVFDATGHPVTGANADISLRMLTMDMGENKAKLSERQPGVYAGKATFGMAGPWEVIATVTKDGASLERKFPVMVK